MRASLRSLFCLFAVACCALAGVEGAYKSTNADTILRINSDGSASYRSLASVTRYKDFEHARKDKQPRQATRTSVSRGKWSTNNDKLLFEGDALVSLEVKGEPLRTERTPLSLTFQIETNGDLIALPGESTSRLVKQAVAPPANPANEPPKSVKIGLNVALSGGDAALDSSGINAAQLFFDELNGSGGIRLAGRPTKIELIVRDNASDKLKAVEATRKFIEEDGVVAIVGPNASGFAVSAAQVADELKCPLICPWSTHPRATRRSSAGDPREYIFRACFLDRDQMEALTAFAANDLKAKTAAILGGGIQASLFRESFEKLGGQVLAFETLPAGQDDSPAFSKIQSLRPDVLFMQQLSREGIEKIKKWGIKARPLGGDNWARAKDLIRERGQELEGAHYVAHFVPDLPEPSVSSFKRSYRKRYGTEPDEIAALIYDSCSVVIEALKRAGICDRTKLRDELGSLWNFRGVTGTFSFKNPPYDPVKSVFIVRVDEGSTRLAKEIQP